MYMKVIYTEPLFCPQMMVIDYKLTYPSGTATAVLINSFHTPHGLEEAL